MPWIESHDALARHPKTKRLARRLDTSVPAVLGHLHLLWWWALEYADDGNLSGFEADEIADVCLWEGDAEEYRAALIGSGWLDETPAGIVVHDWDTYTHRYIEGRRKNAERQARYRERRKTVADPLPNDHVTVTSALRNDPKPAKITSIDSARTKELAEGFNEFYAAYPRKVGKATASKSWFALKPNAELRATIMAALNRHKESHDWCKDDGAFIPHPTTWLNQRRWTDELEAARPSNPNRVYGGEGRLAL